MPAPRVFTPENRLAKILGGAGASEGRVLIADAENRLSLAAGAVRAFVLEEVKTILSLSGKSEHDLLAECHALEDSAVRVAEVAGAVGLETIGEVARGIAAMTTSLRATGVGHAEALALHISSLALISQSSDYKTPDNDVILARLAAMRQAVGVAE